MPLTQSRYDGQPTGTTIGFCQTLNAMPRWSVTCAGRARGCVSTWAAAAGITPRFWQPPGGPWSGSTARSTSAPPHYAAATGLSRPMRPPFRSRTVRSRLLQPCGLHGCRRPPWGDQGGRASVGIGRNAALLRRASMLQRPPCAVDGRRQGAGARHLPRDGMAPDIALVGQQCAETSRDVSSPPGRAAERLRRRRPDDRAPDGAGRPTGAHGPRGPCEQAHSCAT